MLPAREKSQVREPNRYRSLNGARQATAQANKPEKARYYFAKLLAMAGPDVRSCDIQAVRQTHRPQLNQNVV